jgi:Phospholipase_D-nuclease N-terminal
VPADLVFALAAVTLAALVAGWEFFCLTDLAHADRVRFLPRWLWAVLCLAQIPLGGILYLLIGRPWHQSKASGPAAS